MCGGNSCRYAVLEIVLVSVLGWGVVGAALAPAIGQYCGLVVMLTLLFRERALLPEHFATPPSLASIMPLLKVVTLLSTWRLPAKTCTCMLCFHLVLHVITAEFDSI